VISIAGFSPGQSVACGRCGGVLQIPDSARQAQEVPLRAAPAVPSAARPQFASLPMQAPPIRAARPVPTPAAAKLSGPPPVSIDTSAAMRPVSFADKGGSSPAVRGKSRKRSPLVVTVGAFLITSAILTSGLVIGGMLLKQQPVGDWKNPQTGPERIVVKKQAGGRVQLQESQHKPAGPRLAMTRSEFRDKMAALPYDYDPSRGFNVYHSGSDLIDAFGAPHRARAVSGQLAYCWNCSDGTVDVICDPSPTPLAGRSSFIVYRIDNEFY
jgi:hypothetical protein